MFGNGGRLNSVTGGVIGSGLGSPLLLQQDQAVVSGFLAVAAIFPTTSKPVHQSRR